MKRMSPWELEEHIWRDVEGRRWATRQTWRAVMKESLLMWLERHGEIKSTMPNETGASGSVQPAIVLPALKVVEMPPVAPAFSVPQTEAEKEVVRLRGQIEMHKERIEGAKVTLAREPGSLQGAAQLRSSLLIVERREADLVAALEALRVEQEALSSNPIDNGENPACESQEVGEV